MQVNKPIDHTRLRSELAAAGITVPGFYQAVNQLMTFDAQGAIVDLPPDAAPVVAAHTAPPPVDYGTDVVDPSQQPAQTVQSLRAFLTLTTPSNTELRDHLRLLTRVDLWLIKQRVG